MQNCGIVAHGVFRYFRGRFWAKISCEYIQKALYFRNVVWTSFERLRFFLRVIFLRSNTQSYDLIKKTFDKMNKPQIFVACHLNLLRAHVFRGKNVRSAHDFGGFFLMFNSRILINSNEVMLIIYMEEDPQVDISS